VRRSDIEAVILGKKGLPKNNEALHLTGSKGALGAPVSSAFCR
jgi:hypothetical protein